MNIGRFIRGRQSDSTMMSRSIMRLNLKKESFRSINAYGTKSRESTMTDFNI